MKRLLYTLSILLLAFSLNAQSNRSRSERSQESQPAKKEEVKRPSRTTNNPSRKENVQRSAQDRSRSQSEVRSSSQNRSPENRQMEQRNTQRPDVNRERGSTGQPREAVRPRVEESNPERNRERVAEPRSDNSSNVYRPRSATRYERERRAYTPSRERRVVRPAPKTYHAYKPLEYRRNHYVYRVPPRHSIVWDIHMYNEYSRLYPDYHYWYYPIGYRIHTISAYDAHNYIGEVARIYGEVQSTWYSRETDEYFLYIGGPYPYQDFTIILEGRDARRFNRHPSRFFSGRHVAAIGLVSVYEGKPEMFLKKRSQLDVY